MLATGSGAQADETTTSRGASVCTPTVWKPGCTTPISLNGLVHLLASQAATEPPLQFLASYFVVWADGCQTSHGSWAKAEGLGESGQMVELQRAAGPESELVKTWLFERESDPFRRTVVTVTLVDSFGVPLTSWRLSHVLPVLWSVELVNAQSKAVAIETFDLTYDGFTTTSPC